jgi:hypothetical protein
MEQADNPPSETGIYQETELSITAIQKGESYPRADQ